VRAEAWADEFRTAETQTNKSSTESSVQMLFTVFSSLLLFFVIGPIRAKASPTERADYTVE
jgi:hypothetical protein